MVDFKIEKETLRHRFGMNSTIFTVLTMTMKITIMKVMKDMKDLPQEVKSGYKAPDL